uniref:Uncharacterized protein n=1 Tax=Anopheles epiroticus TaxID=199890 RepID=A0A182PB71_9DIPT
MTGGKEINKKQQSMEIRSNYINVPLLAELIERKCRLWAEASFPTPAQGLQRETLSIIESLRLIFRNRAEFVQLTLLRVKSDRHARSLLAPVYEAFLGPPGPATASASTTTTTGLTIYRSNDVETYGRLLLCYARWKSLYWAAEEADATDPVEWADIDAVALAQLPYDFPRAICPRDALLRRIFPAYVTAKCAAGVAPSDRKRNNATTRILLGTLPKRADLQELCLKFYQAYRCGADATQLEDEIPPQGQEAADTPLSGPSTSVTLEHHRQTRYRQ